MHTEAKKDVAIITLGKIFSMVADGKIDVGKKDEKEFLESLEFAALAVASYRDTDPDLINMTDEEASVLLTQLYVSLPQNVLWDDTRRAIDIAVEALGERRIQTLTEENDIDENRDTE